MNTDSEEILRTHGLKNTKQRQIILDEFRNSVSAISQPDLEKKLGNVMDRVTLYRILSTFEQKGIVHSVLDINGTHNYASCSASCTEDNHSDNHLHFNCTSCSKIYCLNVENPEIKVPSGFLAKSISTIITGICKNCQRTNP